MSESSPDKVYGRVFAGKNIWASVRQIKYMSESSPEKYMGDYYTLTRILRYWTGTYWTVANCGFFYGFSTLFRCFVNFKHTTSDMEE
jgi:hypothetical protein